MNHGTLFRDACEAGGSATTFEEVAEVLTNPERAGILDEADRAMLACAEKLTHCPEALTKGEIERMRGAGLAEENIVDALACAAYRNYANRINFALGLVDRDPKGPEALLRAIQGLRTKSG